MKDKIDLLKAAEESLRQMRVALENNNAQEAELKAALEKEKAHLANLPVEAVSRQVRMLARHVFGPCDVPSASE
jgi:hypothetical protein